MQLCAFHPGKNPCFTDHYERHRHQYHHIIIDITVRADEIHKSTTSEPHTTFSSRIILRLPECYQKTENDNYFAFFPHLILASFNFVTQPFGLVQSCCTPKKQTHEKRGEKTSIRKDIVERFSGSGIPLKQFSWLMSCLWGLSLLLW